MEFLFWFCLVGILYSYSIYPLLLLFTPRRRYAAGEGRARPFLSVIITVHNEKHRIRAKIEDTLHASYPPELLEIIVASDASTDGTNGLVLEYRDSGVVLVDVPDRKGKEHAQLQAMRQARGEIFVFTDAGTSIDPESLLNIAKALEDPAVGAVSSEDRVIKPDGTVAGEGLYVRYEMWLRRLESARAGLVGLSGSFFAARKEVCKEWDTCSPSDFNTALNCVQHGYVAITEPRVLGYYSDIKDPANEYRRKLRTVLRGMTGLARHPVVLNPFRFGFFAFQVWSHKIMRWSVPLFMALTLICSLFLAGKHWLYASILGAQVLFYGTVLIGQFWPTMRTLGPIRLVYFFVQVNLAIAHAAILFLSGTRMTVWEPSKR